MEIYNEKIKDLLCVENTSPEIIEDKVWMSTCLVTAASHPSNRKASMSATWRKSLSRHRKKSWTASEKVKATDTSVQQTTMNAAVDHIPFSNWSLKAAQKGSQIALIGASVYLSWYVQKLMDSKYNIALTLASRIWLIWPALKKWLPMLKEERKEPTSTRACSRWETLSPNLQVMSRKYLYAQPNNITWMLTKTDSASHIPFRNSKLTRILQAALSGNARISVICTINPTFASKDESLNTLRFAQRAKLVKTAAKMTRVNRIKAQPCLKTYLLLYRLWTIQSCKTACCRLPNSKQRCKRKMM